MADPTEIDQLAPSNVQLADITMAEAEEDDMPSLEEVSDPSNSEGEYDGDTYAVEMLDLNGDSVSYMQPLIHTVNPFNLPSSSASPSSIPTSASTTSFVSSQRRRARVDDDDDERDRRHPSQRINAASSTTIPAQVIILPSCENRILQLL